MVKSKGTPIGQESGEGIVTKLDALLERKAAPPAASDLPPPAERKRLRESMNLTQAEVAEVVGAKRASVGAWESGRWDPRGEVRDQYVSLLNEIKRRLADRGGNP